MRDTDGSLQRQFRFLRRQYLQDGVLPFDDMLSEDCLSQALTAIEAGWKDRIYSPLVTLWVFLGQVLSLITLSLDRRTLDRSSPLAGTPSMFVRDRRLLLGEKALT